MKDLRAGSWGARESRPQRSAVFARDPNGQPFLLETEGLHHLTSGVQCFGYGRVACMFIPPSKLQIAPAVRPEGWIHITGSGWDLIRAKQIKISYVPTHRINRLGLDLRE